MKTTKNLLAIALVATLGFGIQSCKKDSDSTSTTTPTPVDDSAALMEQASDQTQQMSETEYAMDDANMGMENTDTSSHNGGGGLFGGLFHYNSTGGLSINYNGVNSDGSRSRTGRIDLSLISGSSYDSQGSQSSISFTNYVSRRTQNNSSNSNFILNGTLTITNVSGGKTNNLGNGEHRTQRVSGQILVTFENGTQRSWNITREREIGKDSNGNKYVKVMGYGTYSGSSNVSEYGTNRAGHGFYTVTNTAVQYNDNCGRYRAVAGSVTYKGIQRETTNTYGVDASGNVMSTTGNCAYGYRTNWVDAQGTAQYRTVQYR